MRTVSERTDHEVINRSRLRVDTRKWYASKVLPKKYGDSSTLKHSDQTSGGPPVFIVDISGKPDDQ
jgi:hypothetical protein